MPFPTTAHSTPQQAHTDLINQLIAAGATPNAALAESSGDIIASTVANLLQSFPTSTGLRRYTAALTPALVGANTTAEQTFTVTGVTTADTVVVNKPTAQAGLGIVGVRVTATNTVGITFSNNTGAGITPTAAETYSFIAFRS